MSQILSSVRPRVVPIYMTMDNQEVVHKMGALQLVLSPLTSAYDPGCMKTASKFS
jgi:hypothetical protein